MPPDVARWAYSSRGQRRRRIHLDSGAVQEPLDKCLMDLADLPLGQREHGKNVHAPGERLPGFRQGGVPRRTGEDVPAWPQIPVELGFDGVKQFGDMLVLVDQDRLAGVDEPARVIPHCRPCRWVVAVNHRAPETSG